MNGYQVFFCFLPGEVFLKKALLHPSYNKALFYLTSVRSRTIQIYYSGHLEAIMAIINKNDLNHGK
jgi:hypothetical protein